MASTLAKSTGFWNSGEVNNGLGYVTNSGLMNSGFGNNGEAISGFFNSAAGANVVTDNGHMSGFSNSAVGSNSNLVGLTPGLGTGFFSLRTLAG